MRRPDFDTFLAAHPRDPARAVNMYRAAMHEWRGHADSDLHRPPPWRPFAVGACLLVVALLLMRALGGCRAGAPPVDARGCVAACGREVDACLARCGRMATDVDGGE